jgi:YidC/Oxa1 family membrane protein insertase
MEKRTIIAFVLSFLVLIVWTQFFTPEPVPVEKEETVKTEELDAISDFRKTTDSRPPGEAHLTEDSARSVVPKVDEKEIRVDTPLYTAVFSNIGPTIKSFKLKNYRQSLNPESPLIELVSFRKEAETYDEKEISDADFFLLNFRTPSSVQGENMAYQVDQEAVRLGPGSSPETLVFRAVSNDGLLISQTFRFYPDQYKIDLDMNVENQSEIPAKGVFTAEIKALSSKEKKGYYSYVGLVLLMDGELQEMEIEEVSEKEESKGRIDWLAYEDDYFISAVIPEESLPATFKGRLSASGILAGTYYTPPITLNPSNQETSRYSLYIGPRDLEILKGVGNGLDRAIDFGWFDIIAKGFLYLLLFFNKYINNYGVSIILLTALVKIILWPLSHKSYKSMKEMQKLQPIMTKIREKYKNDKQKMNQEMMGLYKTYKVNPMGGCLPMIVQLPVFFALFRLLGSSIELRHAPFMFWINDLSAPDRLFHFSFSIPFMTPPCGIPVLTLLMGASMFIQQKMTPTPGDPAQAKMMMFMPILFTFMFINFPSGLVLYWLVNNILSIGQQYRIMKSAA